MDDDVRDWTGSKRYDQIKTAAERGYLDIFNTQQWTQQQLNENRYIALLNW